MFVGYHSWREEKTKTAEGATGAASEVVLCDVAGATGWAGSYIRFDGGSTAPTLQMRPLSSPHDPA